MSPLTKCGKTNEPVAIKASSSEVGYSVLKAVRLLASFVLSVVTNQLRCSLVRLCSAVNSFSMPVSF